MAAVDPKGKQLLLPLDASDEELGAAVLDALAHSRFVRPWQQPQVDEVIFDMKALRKRYERWVTKLMKACGYKTRRSLFNKMSNCSVTRREGVITISPSAHAKSEVWTGDGISEEDYVSIPAESLPAEVGAALRLAFSRCR